MSERKRPNLKHCTVNGMISCAPEMRLLFDQIQRAAKSHVTVLVRGESGTGKELVAQALHAQGPRRSNPFRAVNCATFTSEMLASELFGHVKGAFTGAAAAREGLLLQADRGTLFLDEVAEIPLDLQGRLLRVLQERTFTPLGGSSVRRVDIRVVSATNASLRELVANRQFREDLMYRLRVVVLRIPPLRRRTGDLELLTWRWIDRLNDQGGRQITGIAENAWEAMVTYPWPGNIRELDNLLQSAFVLGEGPVLTLADLQPEVRGERPPVNDPTGAPAVAAVADLEQLERDELVAAWQRHSGNRGAIAAELGISRSTLYRRLRQHHLLT